jgi:hypothetical protein
MNAISSIDACIASGCSGLQLSLNDVVFEALLKQKREDLLQQANALLADMADAPAKKNKKKKIEENQDEEEAGLAESMLNVPVIGELSIPAPKPKPKKTAQNDELDRSLAGCTVQRFAGCSVPSDYKFL